MRYATRLLLGLVLFAGVTPGLADGAIYCGRIIGNPVYGPLARCWMTQGFSGGGLVIALLSPLKL